MKQVIAVVVAMLAVGLASAQGYYGSEPAPSMYAAQAGAGVPMPPSYASIMYGGAQPNGAFMAGMPPAAAFVEQQQQQLQQPAYGYAPQAFAPQAAEEDEAAEADAAVEEGEAEAEAEAEMEGEEEGEAQAETEGEEEAAAAVEGDDARFAERRGIGKKLRKLGRKAKRAFRKAKHAIKKAAGKAKKYLKNLTSKRKPSGKRVAAAGPKPRPARPNTWFKPQVGKKGKKKLQRTVNTKTPKSAGKPLPPMPAPLPEKWKVNCKKTPHLCVKAETPAEGEEPGDHSPKAIFKRKMEIIKTALGKNNRNIASESKWIDQVEAIIKQYQAKSKKVKEHINDERKAIKELLRQRRIVLNEKKQKELELKLKIASTELSALTEALQQVQKKEKELGAGKTTLGSKIKLLAADLKALRTKHAADKAQTILRHE